MPDGQFLHGFYHIAPFLASVMGLVMHRQPISGREDEPPPPVWHHIVFDHELLGIGADSCPRILTSRWEDSRSTRLPGVSNKDRMTAYGMHILQRELPGHVHMPTPTPTPMPMPTGAGVYAANIAAMAAALSGPPATFDPPLVHRGMLVATSPHGRAPTAPLLLRAPDSRPDDGHIETEESLRRAEEDQFYYDRAARRYPHLAGDPHALGTAVYMNEYGNVLYTGYEPLSLLLSSLDKVQLQQEVARQMATATMDDLPALVKMTGDDEEEEEEDGEGDNAILGERDDNGHRIHSTRILQAANAVLASHPGVPSIPMPDAEPTPVSEWRREMLREMFQTMAEDNRDSMALLDRQIARTEFKLDRDTSTWMAVRRGEVIMSPWLDGMPETVPHSARRIILEYIRDQPLTGTFVYGPEIDTRDTFPHMRRPWADPPAPLFDDEIVPSGRLDNLRPITYRSVPIIVKGLFA